MFGRPTFLKFTSLLFVFAVILQLAIILYNHFTGYLELTNFTDFVMRWLIGSLLSILAMPVISWPDIYLLTKLNKHLPWEANWFRRLLIEVLCSLLIAIVAASFITTIAHWLSPYKEGLNKILITNALIASVINLILVVFLEAWHWYSARKESEKEKQHLENELRSMQFEMLKNKINPHFMFNSLNVLSGLVRKDAGLAEQFIEAFADVYRYVLETIERPLVTLSEELAFSKSYFFLQQTRHGMNVDWDVDLSAEYMGHKLPPLSLQLLLENAIKHNAFSSENPLIIKINIVDGLLTVGNPLRKKSHLKQSSGTGLQNLIKRYSYISDQIPSFRIRGTDYVAQLPLIPPKF